MYFKVFWQRQTENLPTRCARGFIQWFHRKGGPGVVQKQVESPGTETETLPWGRWQQDWFATPGDIDDFIFYDAPGEPEEDPEP